MIAVADNGLNNGRGDVLGICLRTDGVDVRRVSGTGVQTFTVANDLTVGDDVKILEESVYASPLLLGEFERTTIVFDSPRFTVVPEEVALDGELLESVASLMWPDAAPDSINVSPAAFGAAVISVAGHQLTGFVGRTFTKASLVHRIAALCRVFATLSKPVNNIRLYANLPSAGRLDIVAMTGERLLMANTFECAGNEDAVYFIMAAVKDCGFDPLDDEMLLTGDADVCAAVREALRKYVNSVMPLLLPDKMKEGPLELQIIEI